MSQHVDLYSKAEGEVAITYQQTTDKEIHDRVRSKHCTNISELKRSGFQEFFFFGETSQALGLSPLGLAGLFGTLIALFKEVTKIESNLSVSIFNVALASREYTTYACPFGLGVKFYTSFADGTCIISANFDSPQINDDKEKLYKFAVARTVEATWKDHQRWVDKLTSEGKQKNEHLSFGSYLKLAQQEDNYLLKIKNTTIFGDLFSTVLSIIIAMSLLIGITFTFLSLAAFVQALFPSCLVVSDKTPLPQRILLPLACITISWILARFQTNIFTVDGAGTKLFGRPPTPDSHGYIATKWLVLIIPLLPVRSYKVVGEYSTAQDQARYFMEPIEKLDWIQIKETIWQWKVGYIIFILILIGLITLPLWKCI